jgi:hypothetical protein
VSIVIGERIPCTMYYYMYPTILLCTNVVNMQVKTLYTLTTLCMNNKEYVNVIHNVKRSA